MYKVEINLIVLTGILAISFIVGYFALFVPAGIGVREGLLTLLLKPYMPVDVALMIAILVRCVGISKELLCAAITAKL